MKVHVYSPMWNEEFLLPYYLRHYMQFADKIVLFDNGSTDGSVQTAQAAGVEVRPWDTGGFQDEDMMKDLKNECWKESRGEADWVIVCDVDEFIYHRDLIGYLGRMKREMVSIPQPMGFQLLSYGPPRKDGQIYDEIQIGKYDRKYQSKMAVFDPNAITEIGYFHGAHYAEPKGLVNVRWPSEIKLLHARYLGLNFMYERCLKMRSRLHPKAGSPGWWDYSWTKEKIEKILKKAWHKAQVVVP